MTAARLAADAGRLLGAALILALTFGCTGPRGPEPTAREARDHTALARRLGARDREVRYDAVARFYELGREGLPALRGALAAPGADARVRAARILADFGDDAGIPALLQGLASDRPEIRRSAVQGLSILAPGSLEGVLEGLWDPAAGVRRGCLEVLARAGRRRHLDAVAALLGDPDRGVRLEAIRATGRLMEPGYPPLGVVDALVDPERVVREGARRLLLTRGGYPGAIPAADRPGDLERSVAAIREWVLEVRRIRGR